MGSYTTRIAWETLRSIDSSSFTGSYQALGTPLENPSYICKLINNSNVLITVSIDGTTDVDVAPPNSYWLYDESKNISGIGPLISLPQGTQIYVKGSSGGGNLGSVYLVTQYLLRES